MKKYKAFLLVTILICVTASVYIATKKLDASEAGMKAIVFPLLFLGEKLRMLSLSGWAGNICAWIIYIFLGLAPLTLPVIHIIKKQRKIFQDIFWSISSVSMFFVMFYMINPIYILKLFPEIFSIFLPGTDLFYEILYVLKSSLALVAIAALATAAIIELLKASDGRSPQGLLKASTIIMSGIAVVSGLYFELSKIFIIFGEMLKRSAMDTPGNELYPDADLLQSGQAADIGWPDAIVALLSFIFSIAVCSLLLVSMYKLYDLADKTKTSWFSDDNIKLAAASFKNAKYAIYIALVGGLFNIFAELAVSKWSSNVNIYFSIPLTEILIAAIILILSQFIAQGKIILDENEQFV